MTKLIDGSHWKVSIDAKAVRDAGYDGVLWKATEGTGGEDATFHAARSACEAIGLPFAGFHLGRNTSSGGAQWAVFKAWANPPPGSVVSLDVEHPQAMTDDRIKDWIAAAKGAGHKVLLYGAKPDVVSHVDNVDVFGWYIAWASFDYAGYTIKQLAAKFVPGIGSNPTDTNEYDGTPDELAAFFGGEDDVSKQDVLDAFGLQAEGGTNAGDALAAIFAWGTGGTKPTDPNRAKIFDKLTALETGDGGGGASPGEIADEFASRLGTTP